jgi:hypothetical protein
MMLEIIGFDIACEHQALTPAHSLLKRHGCQIKKPETSLATRFGLSGPVSVRSAKFPITFSFSKPTYTKKSNLSTTFLLEVN